MERRDFEVADGEEAELFSTAFFRFLERELQATEEAELCTLHTRPGVDGATVTVSLWSREAMAAFASFWARFRRERLPARRASRRLREAGPAPLAATP